MLSAAFAPEQEDASIDCSVIGDDGYEDNDSPGTAVEVDSGDPVNPRACAGDDDYFWIDAPVSDTIRVEVWFPHSTGDLSVFLLDPSANQLAVVLASDDEDILFEVTQAGTHYVGVQVVGNIENTYGLEVTVVPPCDDDDLEDDDTFATASTLVSGVTVAAKLCDVDDDYFAIKADAGQIIELSLVHTLASFDVIPSFAGPDESPFANGYPTANGWVAYFAAVDTGDHYVRVTKGLDLVHVQSSYELTATLMPPCVDDEFEPNNSFGDPSPLTPGVKMPAIKCANNQDWFEWSVIQEIESATVWLTVCTSGVRIDGWSNEVEAGMDDGWRLPHTAGVGGADVGVNRCFGSAVDSSGCRRC